MRRRTAGALGSIATVALAGALVIVGVAGCAPAKPTGVPGITGEITYFTIPASSAAIAQITVEGGTQPEGAVSDKAVVAITKKTALLGANGATIKVDALKVGSEVKVWFTGPVAESYPVQGTASAVQLVGAAQ